MDAAKDAQDNPLLATWDTPFGAPPFGRIEKKHFVPAVKAAIEQAREKVEQVKRSPEAPTFDNTILALETADERLKLVGACFWNLYSAESDDELQGYAKEIAPIAAAFASDIALDADLFARVKAVWDRRDGLNLGREEKRLLENSYKGFARNGALLDAQGKERLRAIDQELASLGPSFSDNVLKATNAFQLVIEDEKDLAGLPPTVVETAAEEAKAAGREGAWVFTLQAPSFVPFLTYADRRDLRETLWRAYAGRALGGEFDNSDNIRRIARLRHERANLLGYRTHADFVLEERMAENPQRVQSFLDRLIDVAKPAAERDLEAVKALAKDMGLKGEFKPWDYSYYQEKLKQRDYAYDEEALRPYFKLENVIDGAFEHARRLFGLSFAPKQGVPVYHPDVRAYEVSRSDTGEFVGLLYADFFPRKGKRPGAWMTNFREQGLLDGKVERPIVAIVCNFTKPTATRPSLLNHDEVRTLFHEFGHALHSLLSQCTYQSLAGTNVKWDFVELPSQIMENWTLEKESLDIFARHHESGEPIPAELAEKIRKAATFQAGYAALRQAQFGIIDLSWHAEDPSDIDDVISFERTVTERTRLFPPEEGTNTAVAFSHIFAGGYSAGYYSYKWAEVLDADAFELFKEKGLFDPATGAAFRDFVLSRGDTEPPMELYKRFRGREPDPDALLRRDGLLPAA